MFSNKFYTYKTDFWCAKPETQVNLSTKAWLNLSAPRLKLGNDESGFGQCEIFDIDYSTITTRPDKNTETKTCTSWEYNTEQFDVSAKRNSLKETLVRFSEFFKDYSEIHKKQIIRN